MARKRRIVLPGFPHHVVVRGNNRRVLFSYPKDYRMFLFFLGAALEKRKCRLNALTIMSNHVHLLLTPAEESSLAACVKSFSQRYAQYRNEQRDASGKLSEQRFFSRPVLTDSQIGIVISYIHANPIRAGKVADAADFRWSTHALHAGMSGQADIDVRLWTPIDWWLELGSDWERRGNAYLAVFEECLVRQAVPEPVTDRDILDAVEALSSTPYSLRLRRPNGMRASESLATYRK